MEKKMMMPANYNVMNEEEMTYTTGGSIPIVSIATIGLSVYNEVFAAKVIKNFVNSHKGDNASNFVNAAVNEFSNYVSRDIKSLVIGAYSALNQGFWWPVTGIYCLLA